MSLNWEIVPPSLVLTGGAPRARRSDPLASQAGADRSEAALPSVKESVLKLVSDFENLTGEEINEWYASRDGFPKAHRDSPRKRAGELEADGFLEADRKDNLPAVYSLTDAGRMFLEQVSA